MPGGLRVISRGNGNATVQTTKPATFRESIRFNGQVSGRLPAGTILRGRDNNNNGVPDIIENPFVRGRSSSITDVALPGRAMA